MVRFLIFSIIVIHSFFQIRYKGTKELSGSGKYSITREGDKCILVINNLTPDDVDEYSIKARNKGGSRMCRCNVNVRCKLKLIISNHLIIVGLVSLSTTKISFTTKISRCT
jgi:hypothetical protein